MKPLHKIIGATAGVVCAMLSMSAHAAGLLEMPVYAAEAFDPAFPASATAVGTDDAVLVFRGLTLKDVHAKLEDGWEVFAYFRGENSETDNAVKIVPMCLPKYWPSADAPAKIYAQFNKLIQTGSGSNRKYYVKGFGVVFTERDDGVYVRSIGAANVQKTSSTDPTTCDYTTLDSSTGEATFSTDGNKTVTTDSSKASANIYFLSGVQLAKFVPPGESIVAFENTSIAELAGATLACSLGGRNDNHYSANDASHGCIMTGENTTMTEDGLRVEFQYKASSALYCVVALFTDSGSDVHVKTLAALHASGQDSGYSFVNSDGTFNGTAFASVATGYFGQHLGIYGVKAALPTFETASESAGRYIVTNETTLVWSGLTLSSLKSMIDSGSYRIGAKFNGGSIGNYADCEGAAFNPAYAFDEDTGSLTNICVQFQFRDGGNVKSVKAAFAEQDGSIYAQALGAAAQATNIGYVFAGEDYAGSRTVANASNKGDYGIHDLFIVPVVTLENDEDWTGRGEVALGRSALDLNGHVLTVAGLTSSSSHVPVFNSAYSTTAKLVFDISEGETWTNSTVQIGSFTVQGNNIQVGKTGAGTLVVSKGTRIGTSAYSFGYAGGTLVSDGTLKPGASMLGRLFGVGEGTVTVGPDGVFDVNGWGGGQITDIILDGGKLANSVGIGITSNSGANSQQYRCAKITLTADSTIEGAENIGLYNADVDSVIDLGGCKLTATIADGKMFLLKGKNSVTVKNGTFEISGEGTLKAYSTIIATDNATLVVNCKLDLGSNELSVENYTCGYAGTANAGTGALNVHGVFKPGSAYFYGPTLQPGATIDISLWQGAFPIASSAAAGVTAVSFNNVASGVIYVAASKETIKGEQKILAWDAPPENLTFSRPAGAAGQGCFVWTEADGLYAAYKGLIIILK